MLVPAELDDLDALQALVLASGAPDQPLRPAVGAAEAHHVDIAAAAAEDDPDDLLQLAEVGRGQPQRRHKQRSWELLQHARHEKRALKLEAACAAEKKRAKLLESNMAVVAALHPSIARTLGCNAGSLISPAQMAAVHLRVACTPRPKGAHLKTESGVHRRIVQEVCEYFEFCQGARAQDIAVPPRRLRDSGAPAVHTRIFGFSVQWDETSQKLRPLWKALAGAGQTPQFQSRAEVMMISGSLHAAIAERHPDEQGLIWREEAEPWRVRPVRLESTGTNFLIEALLMSMPIDLRKLGDVESATLNNECVVFTCTMDRASNNLLLCRWVCGWIESELRQRNLVFHPELCNLHGTALVKNRATSLKEVASALYSYTRWLRASRNHALLVDAIRSRISSLVEVKDEQRPAGAREESLNAVMLIYGDFAASHFWRRDKRSGKLVKSQLLVSLEALCDVVDLQATSTTISVWNRVSAGSHEAVDLRMPIGQVICDGRQDMIERVATVVLTVLTGRAWVDASLARWTNVTTTIRRFLIGALVARVLPEALVDIKIGLSLSDDLEDSLLKLVRADAKDYASKNKLKLLRFSRVMAKPSIPWRLGVMVLVGAPVETLQYELLGDGSAKTSLTALVHPKTSPIIMCQNKLWSMAKRFDLSESSPWLLLPKVGADLCMLEVKLYARKHILQLAAGVTQYFDMRMSEGVYRLSWTMFDDIPKEWTLDMLNKLFATPKGCRSFAVSQLVQMFPSIPMMMAKAPPIVRLLLETTATSIDFSERSHNQLRQDLHSAGPAASLASASERILCRQFAAEHVLRGGRDPALEPLPILCAEATGDPKSSGNRKGTGGSGFQYFHNLRLGAFKAMHSPNTPLSADEVRHCEEKIKQEWAAILGDPAEHNLWVNANRNALRGGLAPIQSGTGGACSAILDQGSSSFRGLWSNSGDVGHIVSPDSFAEFRAQRRQQRCVGQPGASQKSRAVVVGAPVPDRASQLLPFTGSLHGCKCNVKNVCREHGVGRAEARQLEALCHRLNKWVDGLPPATRTECSALLLCEGMPTPDGEPEVACLALLVHALMKPKAQLFVRVGVRAGHEAVAMFPPVQFPFTACIMDRVSRLSFEGCVADESLRSLRVETSDELAQSLARAQPHWSFYQVEHDVGAGDTLLDISVTGRGSLVVLPPRSRVVPRKVETVIFPEEFEMGNPTDFAARSSASAFVAVEQPYSADMALGEDDDALITDSDDDAPPAEFAEDVLEGMAEQTHIEAPDYLEAIDAADAEAAPEEVEVVVEALVEAAGHEEAETAERGPPIEEVIASARIGIAGHITTDLMPWAAKGDVGRITVWPSGPQSDPAKQNVAARCYMHSGCSFSRKRARIPDERILRWLFAVKPLATTATPAEKNEAKLEHARLAAEILVYDSPVS